MAFTGTAVVTSVSDREVVITGLSLVSAAEGTIGLFSNSGTPGVRLPASFEAAVYAFLGTTVPLSASIEVTTQPAATGVATAIPVSVVKSGTTPADWLATLTNTHGSLTTPNLEIRVKFH
jgi:hypothetical protein